MHAGICESFQILQLLTFFLEFKQNHRALFQGWIFLKTPVLAEFKKYGRDTISH